MNKVVVLKNGYSRVDDKDPTSMYANCTCTLIIARNGSRIIVDTMTAWDGDNLIKALEEHELCPKDITSVVCTHGHSDHTGCNYLFQNAKWHIVGNCFSYRDNYKNCFENKNYFQIDEEDIKVELTPGHTLSCVTVLVANTQFGSLIGICGDLFECEEDILDESIWLNAGSENQMMQRQNRLMIAEKCDYIIPGHGPGFYVTKEMREKLRNDLKKHQESV